MAWPSRRHTPPTSPEGFTLVELLLVVALGSLILVAATSTILSHIRSSGRQEVVNRLQDHWGRVNVLLENEIAEALSITADGNCASVASQLTLNVPNGSGATTPIRYSVDGAGTLWRCGPSVQPDGSLDFANTADSRVIEGAALAVATVAGNTTTYTLTLTDPVSGLSYANRVSANRTRNRVIN